MMGNNMPETCNVIDKINREYIMHQGGFWCMDVSRYTVSKTQNSVGLFLWKIVHVRLEYFHGLAEESYSFR
jgi:hypothetical protein